MKSVFLVEDDFLVADTMKMVLEDAQWVVVGPSPSVAAASRALNSGERADVAVVDINLNGEFSYPVIDQLCALNIPVVLTTGYDINDLPSEYRQLRRVQKPVTVAQLLECLEDLLAG